MSPAKLMICFRDLIHLFSMRLYIVV